MRQGGTTVLPRSTKMAERFRLGPRALRHRGPHAGEPASRAGDRAGLRLPRGQRHRLHRDGAAAAARRSRSASSANGKLAPEEVDRILWPLLDGLEQVHDAGFLHRDIKPANILLDAAGNPTLIDFGASRAAMAGRSTALTAIFTPGYAAAEQMTSAKQGPWTDIYGLSATLYHAITGQTPPSAFDRMLDDTYEPLAQLDPAGFSPRRAGRRRCRPRGGRPRPAADHRRLAADPRHDRRRPRRTPRWPSARPRHGPTRRSDGTSRPCRRRRRRTRPATGLWIGWSPSCCSPCWAVAVTTPSPRAGPIPRRSRRAPRPRKPKREQPQGRAGGRRSCAPRTSSARRPKQIAAARQAPGGCRGGAPRSSSKTRRGARSRTEIAAQKARRGGGQAQGRRGGRGAPQGGRGCAQGRRVRRRQFRPFRQDADDDRPEGPAGRDPPAGRRHRQRSRRCTRSPSTRWPPSRATCAAGRPTA